MNWTDKDNLKIIKKNIILVGIVVVLLSVSYTLARTFWESTDNTTIDATIGEFDDSFETEFINGNNVNVSNLAPTFDYHDGVEVEFAVHNKTNTDLTMKVILNITSIASQLKSNDFKYILEELNSTTKKYEIVESGNFSGVSTGAKTIKSGITCSYGYTYFRFYVYIDGNGENNTNMMGKSLVSTLYVTNN